MLGRGLILFADGLKIGFAVGVEKIFAALLPAGSEIGGGDVPVWAAFLGDGAEVLAEFFDGGTAEEPVAVVNLVNYETGLEDDHVGDHEIVERVGVFGDVEIFLDDAAGVGKERPLCADAAAIFVRFGDVVGADGYEAAVGNLELTMQLNEAFGLTTVLGAEASAAEDKNHGMRALQFREFAMFRGVVGKLVIRKDGAGKNVGSHLDSWWFGFEPLVYAQRGGPRKPRTRAAISSAAVSRAKWPPSTMWTSALGTSWR